jgi:hypothetical protein
VSWFLAYLTCAFAGTVEAHSKDGLAFEAGVGGLGVPFAHSLQDRPPTESGGSQGYLAGFAGLHWRWNTGWETGVRVAVCFDPFQESSGSTRTFAFIPVKDLTVSREDRISTLTVVDAASFSFD